MFQGFISRTACVPKWAVTVSVVTNAIDGLANQWVEGVLSILHEFARKGRPQPAVAGWTGRWWSYWGDAVLIGLPGQLMPLADASLLTISSPTEGQIALTNGFGSHGESIYRTLGPDGTAQRLQFGGTEMPPEDALLAEVADQNTAAPV